MNVETLRDKIKERLLSWEGRQQTEAIGIFGSLSRGRDFGPRSDIDIFIVVKDEEFRPDLDLYWYLEVSAVLQEFGRDVTVLVFTIESLREIACWEILRLASEGILLYDRDGIIEKLFEDILEAARKAGLEEVEVEGCRKIWRKKEIDFGEIFAVEVKGEE